MRAMPIRRTTPPPWSIVGFGAGRSRALDQPPSAELLAAEIEQLEHEYLVADEDADVTRQWQQLIKTQQREG